MPPQKRFIRRGVAKIFFLPAVADPTTGPTQIEVDAGDDITDWIAAVTGFGVTSTSVPTPDMGSRFDSTIPGNTSVSDSSFRFYDDLDAEEIETLFPYGAEGFIFIAHKGYTPAKPALLFPTRVASRAPNLTADMAPADNTVTFNITSEPNMDSVVPAAA